MCCSNIYGVRGFHVYKSVFLGWVVGRFNIAVNGEHNCGVPPDELIIFYPWQANTLTFCLENDRLFIKIVVFLIVSIFAENCGCRLDNTRAFDQSTLSFRLRMDFLCPLQVESF